MAEFKLVLPEMGEGVQEATLISWLVNEGETIQEDDSVIEIATDKVDSDVPSPVAGTLVKKLFEPDQVIKIGEVFAIIETEQEISVESDIVVDIQEDVGEVAPEPEVVEKLSQPIEIQKPAADFSQANTFLSPLVKTIIEKEGIPMSEVNQIQGTGKEGRITKNDIMAYLKDDSKPKETSSSQKSTPKASASTISNGAASTSIGNKEVKSSSTENDIIEMDRMRKLIAEHMVESKKISPHVTSFIETDVTTVVNWRNKHKDAFYKREGEKLTFMPIFIWAVAKAIKDFPMINVSVEGDKIIRKKNINIGMATALPSGNLIVPVIKNADKYNITGLAKYINDLANRARNNKLKPDDIQGGTYTVTNLGTFGNIMGTPIINQPEVAILAVGAIEKKPAVIETPNGDLIGIRNKMFMSHAYDHRVVDGALGGMFLQRVHHYLEDFNPDTEV